MRARAFPLRMRAAAASLMRNTSADSLSGGGTSVSSSSVTALCLRSHAASGGDTSISSHAFIAPRARASRRSLPPAGFDGCARDETVLELCSCRRAAWPHAGGAAATAVKALIPQAWACGGSCSAGRHAQPCNGASAWRRCCVQHGIAPPPRPVAQERRSPVRPVCFIQRWPPSPACASASAPSTASNRCAAGAAIAMQVATPTGTRSPARLARRQQPRPQPQHGRRSSAGGGSSSPAVRNSGTGRPTSTASKPAPQAAPAALRCAPDGRRQGTGTSAAHRR